MLQRFQSFIIEKELFNNNTRLIVAVSGGVDSVVLCNLLHLLKYNFGIAHCNFGLRDGESDDDDLFVKNLASSYHVPFFHKKFDTKIYAKDNKISIQMAARKLRYDWFDEISTKEDINYILTAHHKSDIIETMILNLVRGTGIAGLHGIVEKNGKIIRPLLSFEKAEILDYARNQKLEWREDSSNFSDKYSRNKIRNQVIPLLKEINPHVEDTFSKNAAKLKSIESFFLGHINNVKKQVIIQRGNNIYIDLAKLKPYLTDICILAELLKPYNYSWSISIDIYNAIKKISGKKFYSYTHLLVKDRDQLIITELKEEEAEEEMYITEEIGLLITKNFTINWLVAEDLNVNKDHKSAYLDRNKITFPITLRKWRNGDKFYPFGMKGQKKISDYLIDKKISLIEKDQVWVLTSGEEIIWLVGYTISDHYKVTVQTKEILKFTV